MPSDRVATAADHQTIPAAIATVAHAWEDGTVDVLEVDGVLFKREAKQKHAREELERSARYRQVRDLGVSHELLSQLYNDTVGPILDETEEIIRNIGFLLTRHGERALWQLVYMEYARESGYCLGDEDLFLLNKPTSSMDGYQGPGVRLNSAIEAAAQNRRRAGKG